MSKKKILVIDDDEKLNAAIKAELENTGRFDVAVEANSDRGMATIRNTKPDLILLDILMLKTSGVDIAAEIQHDPELNKIPFIFLTAAVAKDEVEEQRGTIGGYPFIAKPASAGEIVERIESILGQF